VGGQPTAGFFVDFLAIAKGCGYKTVLRVEKHKELKNKISILKKSKGPALLEIRVAKGARHNLGRPSLSPFENRRLFMKFLK
jgi:phosphonopyruvate decarboxylase